MTSKSTVEGKSEYDKQRNRLRFQGIEGQNQGCSARGQNQWVPKLKGLFAYPVSNSKASV